MTDLKKSTALFEELKEKLTATGQATTKKGSELKDHITVLQSLQDRDEKELKPLITKLVGKAQLPPEKRLLNEKTCNTILQLSKEREEWLESVLGKELEAAQSGSAAVDAAKAKKERKYKFNADRKALEEQESVFRKAVEEEEAAQFAPIAEAVEKKLTAWRKYEKRAAHHETKKSTQSAMAPSTASKTKMAHAKKEVETGVSLLTQLELAVADCLDEQDEECELLMANEDARWSELIEDAQLELRQLFECKMEMERADDTANRSRKWTENILIDSFVKLPVAEADDGQKRNNGDEDDDLQDERQGVLPWFPFQSGTCWKVERVVGPRYQLRMVVDSTSRGKQKRAETATAVAKILMDFDVTVELYDLAFELIFLPYHGQTASSNGQPQLPARRDELEGTIFVVPECSAATATKTVPATLTKTQKKKFKKKHADPSVSVEELSTDANPFVAMISAQGGYFAGAVFNVHEPLSKPLAHKTFARYVTRRGQGGRQSAHSGRTDTAGSQIRAQMEKKWIEESTALMNEWLQKGLFDPCHAVLYHAPGASNHAMVAGKDSPLGSTPHFSAVSSSASSKKQMSSPPPHGNVLRSLPIPSGRPTLTEVHRCMAQLLSGSIVVERRCQ